MANRVKTILEQLVAEDYTSFVKELLRIETNLPSALLNRLYDFYMQKDEMTLINPEFYDLAKQASLCVEEELKKLLSYSSSDRDQIVAVLQEYFAHQKSIQDVGDFSQLSQEQQAHLVELTEDHDDYHTTVREEFGRIYNEEFPSDGVISFNDLVEASVARELLTDKEAFLKNYHSVLKEELDGLLPNKDTDAERGDISPSL